MGRLDNATFSCSRVWERIDFWIYFGVGSHRAAPYEALFKNGSQARREPEYRGNEYLSNGWEKAGTSDTGRRCIERSDTHRHRYEMGRGAVGVAARYLV